MYKVRTLNNIANIGLKKLTAREFDVSDRIENPDGIILRSFDMHQMELPESLLAIARAGAGTNNIPIDKCSEKGIVVFNTPGANANAVKELVLTAMFISSRKVVEGINWVQTLKENENLEKAVEAGKKQFIGPEIMGKKLAVIGLGAIGVLVANAARALGMEVVGYDPYLSIDAAWHLSSSVNKAVSIEEAVSQCDYITMHIPLNAKTKYMYNKELFSATKKGARLLNFSRGELVEPQALKEAIQKGIIEKYITDFPNEELLGTENVIIMPHLGASTPESEENCAEMAARELRDYLEYGNIRNSVNFPNCEIPYNGKTRVAVIHKNIPNMIGSIATEFAKRDINIDNMINKSKADLAYTLVVCDTLNEKNEELLNQIKQIKGVIATRVVIEAVD